MKKWLLKLNILCGLIMACLLDSKSFIPCVILLINAIIFAVSAWVYAE